MYAIMYTDVDIVKLDYSNNYEFKCYDKAQTFSEAKIAIIDYWETMKSDSERNIKTAKKLRLTTSPEIVER